MFIMFIMSRFVYVPEDENSSKSLEMERVMREARLRELVKGVYSNSYGDPVNTKVASHLSQLTTSPVEMFYHAF